MPFDELRREVDWWLQGRLTFSAPVIKRTIGGFERAESLVEGAARERLRRLRERYPIEGWSTRCTSAEFLHNLYLLDLLDRLPIETDPGPALDIGCASWGYLPALVAWSGGPWDGVELDAHRRHLTLVTRRGYGEWMARRHPGCRYLAESVLDLAGAYRTITWFLPLVTEGRHVAHRLPRRLFQPLELLRHAWARLEPGGRLVVVNQEEAEMIAQRRLFALAGIPVTPLGMLDSAVPLYRHPRYGWIARK